jgi:hypothetical protein
MNKPKVEIGGKPFIIAQGRHSNGVDDVFLLRRTFQAAQHPKDSDIRKALNEDALTSEYMPSYKYMVRRPARMTDGSPNPAQVWYDMEFVSKAEAWNYFNSLIS